MNAWADGLNYYLATHPQVKPRVITQFEPWMALSFSEGEHRRRYRAGLAEPARGLLCGQAHGPGRRRTRPACASRSRRGSNGFAIAPSNTAGRPRPAADQSPHLVLLPLRGAGGQRRRAERLWRGHLGPVLRLSGLQPACGLDAHLQRRGRGRRVRRDHRAQGRQALLQVRG